MASRAFSRSSLIWWSIKVLQQKLWTVRI